MGPWPQSSSQIFGVSFLFHISTRILCSFVSSLINQVHSSIYSTNADPHNASRGFFFSHIGWLMCKKHPDVVKYGKRVDMTDLTSDPVLQFQKKYYIPLVILCTFVLPITLTMKMFGTPFWIAYHWHVMRYVVSLHITWSINSVSHIWGSKPFEK